MTCPVPFTAHRPTGSPDDCWWGLTCSKPPSSWTQACGGSAEAPQPLRRSRGWSPVACASAAVSSHTDSRGCRTTSRSWPLTRISRPPLCQESSQQGWGQQAVPLSLVSPPPDLPGRTHRSPWWPRSSPSEADAGLRCRELGVGGVAERAGSQCALGLAKDHANHSFSWAGLGHGVAHNGLRTHWLLAAGGRGSGILDSSFSLATSQVPRFTSL